MHYGGPVFVVALCRHHMPEEQWSTAEALWCQQRPCGARGAEEQAVTVTVTQRCDAGRAATGRARSS